MTEKANPSINRPAEAFKTAGAIAYGGHGAQGDPGFVVDGASPTEIASQDGGITEANLNAFAETSSGSSLDVDIDAGEAFVFGTWLAIDTTTTVTLTASTNGQTVYVGWNKDGSDDVIVGLSSAFESASGDTDMKIPLWDFDTDGTGVTASTDRRLIGYSQSIIGKQFFGGTPDFSMGYDSGTDELELIDETNDVIKQSWDKSGDTTIPNGDILDGSGNTVYSQTNNWVPQTRLENDSVTVAGNSVALGASTTVDYVDLNDTGASFPIPNTDLSNSSVTVAGNVVSLGGSTTIDHSDLSNIGSSDHHTKYTDSEAISAINNDADHGSTAQHDYLTTSDVTSSNWNDYELQKNGSDTNGVINFKTS